jgi:hypothetical protein
MKKSDFLAMTLLLAFCINELPVYAQIDTIRLTDNRLKTSSLKPGLGQYLVYSQNAKKTKSLYFSLWLRDVEFADRNGEKVITITQHWYGNDSSSYRKIYSVNKSSDFAPVYHSEAIGGKVKAYNWELNKITGADTLAGNLAKDFSLDFKEPNYNWNLDMETFEMLPLAANKTFVINFYDAGLSPPEYVVYKVTGSEILATLDNSKIDCWKLYTDGYYKGKQYTQKFWISKKEHEFLKEIETYDSNYTYKVKLMRSAQNILQRFINK